MAGQIFQCRVRAPGERDGRSSLSDLPACSAPAFTARTSQVALPHRKNRIMNMAIKSALRLLGILALGVGLAVPAQSQAIKGKRLTAGLSAPLYACAPSGDVSRIFIVQQGGLIRILKGSTLLTTPFMNLGP